MGDWATAPIPAPRRSAAALPPFVGRQEQFAALDDVWQVVEQGERRVVLVEAEAGAGKTRLVTEAVGLLRRQGVPVLVGRCVAELGSAYDPFVEPLAGLLGLLDPGTLDHPSAGPDSATNLELLRLITTGMPASDVPEWLHQQAIFRAATEALVAAAAERPLVLVLEDVHWAGDSGLRLLRFAMERSRDAPVLFLVTLRTEASGPSPQAISLLSDLLRTDGVIRLDLPGLVPSEITEYLVRGAGLTPASAGRVAPELHDVTGGNPFLLREVCRDRAVDLTAGGLSRDALRAPESFRASTSARLDRLTPGERTLVETAAVIGEEFDVPLLAVSRGALDDPATPDLPLASVFAALESGQALGLVEWVPERSGVGRFPHALARQAVLDQLSQYDRATANARVAVALKDRFPAADRRVQRLAHHFANAAALGFAEEATDALEAAGDAAEARLAHGDAAALYEQGAQHAQSPTRRDDLLLAAARAAQQAGEFTHARAVAERVATTGSPEQALRAAVVFEDARFRTPTDQARARSIELLVAALERTRGDQHPDRTRILATAALARSLSVSDQKGRSPALRDDALRQARGLGDPDLLAEVLKITVTHALAHEDLAESLRLADELTRLVDATGNVERLGPAAYFRCLSHYTLGDPAGFELAQHDLIRMARDTLEPYWALAVSLATFGVHLMRCEFADAEATLRSTAQTAAAFEQWDDATEGAWSLQSFMLRRETGRLAAARSLITGEEDPTQAWAPGLLGLYTEYEMAGPAQRMLDWLLSTGLGTRQRSASWPLVLAMLVDAAVWLQDREAARTLLPLANCYEGRNLSAELLVMGGSGERLIGTLESALGEPSAEEHFIAALEMDARMGAPLHRATTLADYVRHLRRDGAAQARAEPLAEEARALCERHQLVRVQRLLDASAPRPTPAARRDGLTSRETEVLRLLGRGLSNREIAATLVISEYTAANHVRNILIKTQCANRTQAAMYAVEHGLAAATR